MKKQWFSVHAYLDKLWYKNAFERWFFLPFSWVYHAIIVLRRCYLKKNRQQHFSVPIIVVGNITVGGVGKTPLVIALAEQLQARGLRVGIVSRGYGALATHFPHEVCETDCASYVGDEPHILAKRARCPVVIAPERVQAVRYLLDKYQSQVIISDDGLQHYKMGRAIEIAVIDGTRGLGNGLCLPAGPLREGASRLRQVDFVIVNGSTKPGTYRMDLQPGQLTQLTTGDEMALSQLQTPVAAVAGIGNPSRFFTMLRTLGVAFNSYPFADHYQFQQSDLLLPEKMIVMTEKDAVKCHKFATDSMYFLPVDAKVGDEFWDALWAHKQLQGYV